MSSTDTASRTRATAKAGDHLSADELFRITDSKQARRQIAWLHAHRVPFRFDGKEVKVLRLVAQEWELLSAIKPAHERHAMLR